MRLFSALLLGVALAPSLTMAEGRSIIVLDASGSMWGQIDGRAKLEIAREALANVLGSIPAETEIGLMAYGHRSKGDCKDIELVVPPAAGTGPAIIDAANKMKFLGKTPLTEAVRQAAADLKSTEEKATVILITDGIETCEADPCALGRELEASGVDFTAHVVGFGLTDDEGKAVACLAENTGGKYIPASDAGQLVEALKTTVVLAEPEPTPPPAPEPAKLDRNIDPVVLLTEGGQEPEIVRDAIFSFYPMTDKGPAKDYTATIYGTTTDYLPPGRYLMKTELHEAKAEQEVEITDSELAKPVVILDAGILNLKVVPTEGGEPDNDGFFEVRGPDDIGESGYGQVVRVFPAGEYALHTELGAAKGDQSIVIEAGKTLDKTVVMGIGVAGIEAYYTDSMRVEGGDHFIEIFEAKKDLDGNRKQVDYDYGAGHTFDLPPGEYVAQVSLGGTKVEQPFTVKTGERIDLKVVLNAGVAAFATPSDEFIEVQLPTKDINGNTTQVAYGYGPAWQTTLPAGDYIAHVDKDGAKSDTPFTVKAGERLELTLSPKAP